MTELREAAYEIPAARLGPENPLPMFRRRRDDVAVGVTDEVPPEDRTYLGWRTAYHVLPYRLQDDYDRVKRPRAFRALVLENEKLRATVLPELGGRLVSLLRKRDQRELLDRNPVFQPANLALRNAWFSGGIEWNAGLLGHHYHTCAPVYAARIRGPGGVPALRLYEWDRVKRFPFQIDLHLPPGSDFLLARVRIVNPHDAILPMYWWTNIAVPEAEGTRTLCPAAEMLHSVDGKLVDLGRLPLVNGVDLTYSTNRRGAHEQFFRIPPGQRPWIAALDRTGQGFIQTSTALLKGRKAFYWGRNQGGQRWQEFLAQTGCAYIEIQAGLARTQVESLPMPPRASWEWTEAFGAVSTDPTVVHGDDWTLATGEVDGALERALPRAAVDALDRELARSTAAPAEQVLHEGSPWATLERRRLAKAGGRDGVPAELTFTQPGAEQAPWLALLERGALPECDPADPGALMTQPEWQALLEAALAAGRGDHWAAWWHLGNMRLENRDEAGAKAAWERSLKHRRTAWALRNLAVLAAREDDPALMSMGKPASETPSPRMVELLMQAWEAGPATEPLAIEIAVALNGLGEFARAKAFIDSVPAEMRAHERLRIQSAHAALHQGGLDEVERLFDGDFATIREGEVTLTDLWFSLHERRLAGGKPVDAALRARVRRDHPPPKKIDFRVLADIAEEETRQASRRG